ncbi:MAG: CHAT domain-containing protein [Paludibacteraceae bacterium]|nr:CHAT domain-containing protein [Paludibacteraceae bacterium]
MKRVVIILFLFCCLLKGNANAQGNASQNGNAYNYWNQEYFYDLKTRVMNADKHDLTALTALEKEIESFFHELEEGSNIQQLYAYPYSLVELYISGILLKEHKFEEAEQHALLAVSLTDGYQTAKTLAYKRLAMTYSYQAMADENINDYTKAIEHSLLSIKYSDIAGDKNSSLKQYIHLGRQYAAIGNLNDAEGSLRKAETINQSNTGDEKKLFEAEICYERAEISRKNNDYKSAIAWLETCYDNYTQIDAVAIDTKRANVCKTISNMYRNDLHNEQKALLWEARAEENYQKEKLSDNLPKKDSNFDRFLDIKEKYFEIVKINNKGDHRRAIELYSEVINNHLEGKEIIPESILADYYSSRARSYIRIKNFENARNDMLQAIQLLSSDRSEQKSLIDCYTLLSNIYYQLGDIPDAVEASKKSLIIAQQTLPAYSEELKDCYSHLANIEAFNGDFEQAKENLMKATDITVKTVKNNFSYLTGQEREQYWKVLQKDVVNSQPFLLMLGEDNSIYSDALYDMQLMSKGILLQSEIGVLSAVNKSPELQRLYRAISDLRHQASSVDSKDSTEMILQRAEKLERELTEKSSEIDDFLSFMNIKSNDIKQHLSKNNVAIEFATFKYRKDSLITAAYIIKPQWRHVRVLKLFDQTQFDRISSADFYKTPQLYELVWKPILDLIGTTDTIFFAPSGSLFNTAIEYVPDNNNKIINDRIPIFRLSSTRQLVAKRKPADNKNAVLYGGLLYDMSADSISSAVSRHRGVISTIDSSNQLVIDRGVTEIDYLPGTLKEVEEIASYLPSARLYTLMEGVEETFKQLSGKSPAIIHIATHGFTQQVPEQAQQSLNGALDYCGLLMSGSQLAWFKQPLPDNVEDGILTAKEIAAIDLTGCQIAILSACQTGKGLITSDGVAGLQRGFKQAGVKTLIVSLWDVNDDATQLLMTELYKLLEEKGYGLHEAFRLAQLSVRRLHPEPQYWAGFILLDAIN